MQKLIEKMSRMPTMQLSSALEPAGSGSRPPRDRLFNNNRSSVTATRSLGREAPSIPRGSSNMVPRRTPVARTTVTTTVTRRGASLGRAQAPPVKSATSVEEQTHIQHCTEDITNFHIIIENLFFVLESIQFVD